MVGPPPPNRKGEGRSQEAGFPDFTSQLPAAAGRPAVPSIPPQPSPFSTPGGDPARSFSQGFLPRVWLLPPVRQD